MKKTIALILALTLLCAAGTVFAEASGQKGKTEAQEISFTTFLADLASMDENRIDGDVAALDDALAAAVATKWKEVFMDPGYRIFLDGQDDPAELPVTGKHAFVVLGFQLKNGQMQDELKARCNAAAKAAKAFPDSILVCSGGATGKENPDKNTEAGLMKDYLVRECGIDAGRIFTDERAMSTEENAVNTFTILKEQGIEQITIVTSDYHQKRANILYFAGAEAMKQNEGYSFELIGNYACETEKGKQAAKGEAQMAVIQLNSLLAKMRDEAASD